MLTEVNDRHHKRVNERFCSSELGQDNPFGCHSLVIGNSTILCLFE